MTRPAQWCGCFGLRPTFGAVSGHGVEPCAPKWDTPGILGRDIARLGVFAAEWLLQDHLVKESQAFTSIIWPSDFWSIIDQEQIDISRRFLEDLEKHLGVRTEEISFIDEWTKSAPPEADGKSLLEFIAGVCYTPQSFPSYIANFRRPQPVRPTMATIMNPISAPGTKSYMVAIPSSARGFSASGV